MSQSKEIQYFQANLDDERNSAYLYQTLADIEKNPQIAEVYRRLAATEQSHAEAWSKKLAEAGVVVVTFKPAGRTRTLAWLARRFGAAAILPTIGISKIDFISFFKNNPRTEFSDFVRYPLSFREFICS